MSTETPFPEIRAATDPKQVPWHDAVVWSERSSGGQRVYEWLLKGDIRQVSWTTGLLSIQISSSSPLDRDLMYILIQAPFVSIGRNVPIG